MAEQQLSLGGSDGAVLGQSASDKIAFFGASATVQPSCTVLGALTAGSSTAADVAAALVELRTALAALGIIRTTA